MRSHNINKQAPEAFIHSDLHKAWDIWFYQELTRSPQLPLVGHLRLFNRRYFPPFYNRVMREPALSYPNA